MILTHPFFVLSQPNSKLLHAWQTWCRPPCLESCAIWQTIPPIKIMEQSRSSPICTQFWIRCTIVVRHLHPYNKYIWQVKSNITMRFEQLTALTKDYFCDTLGFSGTWMSFWSNEDGNQHINSTNLWCSISSTQRFWNHTKYVQGDFLSLVFLHLLGKNLTSVYEVLILKRGRSSST
jgi:hypothetical protein